MKYKAILFDLDGTLSNSYAGITSSFQYALGHFGIEATDEQLRKAIGPHINDSFATIWGIPEDRVNEAVLRYREYFTDSGIYEHRMYDGVAEMISDLAERGVQVVTASSKPVVFVRKVLESYGIAQYFRLIVGSELSGVRSQKVDIINYIIRKLEIKDRSTVLMVGDRKYDLIGAQEAEVDGIGVLYGYAEENELESYPSVFLAKTVKDLHRYIVDNLY